MFVQVPEGLVEEELASGVAAPDIVAVVSVVEG
jgi:hypothetical protein